MENYSQLQWTFEDRLLKSLRASGVGTSEMAEHLGVSRATITNWTSGRTSPTKGMIRAWAQLTGVPFDWLLTGSESSAEEE